MENESNKVSDLLNKYREFKHHQIEYSRLDSNKISISDVISTMKIRKRIASDKNKLSLMNNFEKINFRFRISF